MHHRKLVHPLEHSLTYRLYLEGQAEKSFRSNIERIVNTSGTGDYRTVFVDAAVVDALGSDTGTTHQTYTLNLYLFHFGYDILLFLHSQCPPV